MCPRPPPWLRQGSSPRTQKPTPCILSYKYPTKDSSVGWCKGHFFVMEVSQATTISPLSLDQASGFQRFIFYYKS